MASNTGDQQVTVLIIWEEELPDLLDTKQNGSGAVAVFNSSRRTTSSTSHKHKYGW